MTLGEDHEEDQPVGDPDPIVHEITTGFDQATKRTHVSALALEGLSSSGWRRSNSNAMAASVGSSLAPLGEKVVVPRWLWPGYQVVEDVVRCAHNNLSKGLPFE